MSTLKKILQYLLLPLTVILIALKFLFKKTHPSIIPTQSQDNQLEKEQHEAQTQSQKHEANAQSIQEQIEQPNTDEDWHRR